MKKPKPFATEVELCAAFLAALLNAMRLTRAARHQMLFCDAQVPKSSINRLDRPWNGEYLMKVLPRHAIVTVRLDSLGKRKAIRTKLKGTARCIHDLKLFVIIDQILELWWFLARKLHDVVGTEKKSHRAFGISCSHVAEEIATEKPTKGTHGAPESPNTEYEHVRTPALSAPIDKGVCDARAQPTQSGRKQRPHNREVDCDERTVGGHFAGRYRVDRSCNSAEHEHIEQGEAAPVEPRPGFNGFGCWLHHSPAAIGGISTAEAAYVERAS